MAIDDDYYVNLTDVTGHYMWKCFYIGDNKFCLQLYTQAGKAGFEEGSHKTFGIFDVKTKQYTPVTGLPDADTINDIALAYAADTDGNTITFEVRPPTAGCLPSTPSAKTAQPHAARRSTLSQSMA